MMCPECGGPIYRQARLCRPCTNRLGGPLVNAVVEHYPEESARSIAARLGTSEMAVYNTASRLRGRLPGSVGYRNGREI